MLRPAFLLLTAAMMLPAAAGAVTYIAVPGAPDPGAPGQTLLVDFDTPLPAGYSLAGSYGITSGTTGTAAAPAGNDSLYFYTSSALGTGSATLSTLDLTDVSFYWGSIDTYNSVDVLLSGGGVFHLDGSAVPPSTGNQSAPSTNQRLFFTAEAGETITGLRFNTTGVAFEIDDVYGTLADDGTGSTVPEPANWAMLIAGFGLVGAASRRRRMANVAA